MSRFFGLLAIATATISLPAVGCNNIWWNPGSTPIKPIGAQDRDASSAISAGRTTLEIQRDPATGTPTAYRFGNGEFQTLPIDFEVWRSNKSYLDRMAKPKDIAPASGCDDDWYISIGSLGSYNFYSTLNHNFLFDLFTREQRTARQIFEEWFRRQRNCQTTLDSCMASASHYRSAGLTDCANARINGSFRIGDIFGAGGERSFNESCTRARDDSYFAEMGICNAGYRSCMGY